MWIVDALGCRRWVGADTVARWRSWAVGHPGWVAPLRRLTDAASGCMKAGAIVAPLALLPSSQPQPASGPPPIARPAPTPLRAASMAPAPPAAASGLEQVAAAAQSLPGEGITAGVPSQPRFFAARRLPPVIPGDDIGTDGGTTPDASTGPTNGRVTLVAEPGSLVLLAAGVALMFLFRRRPIAWKRGR